GSATTREQQGANSSECSVHGLSHTTSVVPRRGSIHDAGPAAIAAAACGHSASRAGRISTTRPQLHCTLEQRIAALNNRGLVPRIPVMKLLIDREKRAD